VTKNHGTSQQLVLQQHLPKVSGKAALENSRTTQATQEIKQIIGQL